MKLFILDFGHFTNWNTEVSPKLQIKTGIEAFKVETNQLSKIMVNNASLKLSFHNPI